MTHVKPHYRKVKGKRKRTFIRGHNRKTKKRKKSYGYLPLRTKKELTDKQYNKLKDKPMHALTDEEFLLITERRKNKNFGMGYFEDPLEREKIAHKITKLEGKSDNARARAIREFGTLEDYEYASITRAREDATKEILKEMGLMTKKGKLKERYGPSEKSPKVFPEDLPRSPTQAELDKKWDKKRTDKLYKDIKNLGKKK